MPKSRIPRIKISVSFDKKIKKSEFIHITSSEDSYDLFKNIFNADTFDWREEFVILCLNNSNRVVGFYKLSCGGMTSTIVDIRMIFTTALNSLATKIILAHNHPSGKLYPSESDKKITRKIIDAGKLLDIQILDHLIINDEDYFSFAKSGLL